jgi:DNA repair protein RadC
MGYQQTATSEQITLFSQETPTPTRRKGIPIYRVSLVREGKVQSTYEKITTSAMASALLYSYLSDADREMFVVILLDRKNQVIGINTVSIGSLTASIVHPRETFKAAILSNAADCWAFRYWIMWCWDVMGSISRLRTNTCCENQHATVGP